MKREISTCSFTGTGKLPHDDGSETEIQLTWAWTSADPLVVSITFHVEPQDVRWEISRELLDEALRDYQTHGDGDVSLVRTWPDRLVIMLDTPSDGSAVIDTTDRAAQNLVKRSKLKVPIGQEYDETDLDDLVSRIFAEEKA